MKNVVIVVLVLTVAVLAGMVMSLRNSVLALKEHPKQVAATPEPAVPSIERQAMCAKQAKEVLKQEGWETERDADFTSHFNVKLGRCFVVISSTSADKKSASNFKSLSDAFENKVYGTHHWINVFSQHKKFWEVDPVECNVTMPSGEEEQCKSSESFDRLAKTYVE